MAARLPPGEPRAPAAPQVPRREGLTAPTVQFGQEQRTRDEAVLSRGAREPAWMQRRQPRRLLRAQAARGKLPLVVEAAPSPDEPRALRQPARLKPPPLPEPARLAWEKRALSARRNR